MTEKDDKQTTAVATQQKPPLVAGPQKVLAIVPTDIDQVYRMANAVCRADMAPKGFEKNVEKVSVAIMHGLEVGLTPMAALQSIAVINGMPTIYGDGALALIRGSGLLEDMDETMTGEDDARKATCTMRRVKQTTPIQHSFSVEDAKQADLWGKKGPWQGYPQRMLQMRARSWCMRDGFADVLKGLGIREEVPDMGELVEGGDGTYAPARPTRVTHAQEAREAAHADAMDAEYSRAAGVEMMPDTPEERGEVAEGSEEATDEQDETEGEEGPATDEAAPEPENDYVEGMLERFGGIGTLDALQTVWAEAGPKIRRLSDTEYDRLDLAYGERALELRKQDDHN